jgi:hypothetical protein
VSKKILDVWFLCKAFWIMCLFGGIFLIYSNVLAIIILTALHGNTPLAFGILILSSIMLYLFYAFYINVSSFVNFSPVFSVFQTPQGIFYYLRWYKILVLLWVLLMIIRIFQLL